MPFEQTITIINSSGKIVSTGKHLIGIFKEARAAYKEKKEALRYERAGGGSAFCNAHTFSGPVVEEADDEGDEYDDTCHHHPQGLNYGPPLPLLEDRRSHRHRHRHRLSRSSSIGDEGRTIHMSHDCRRLEPPSLLTASNLRTHSEISATYPYRVPLSYHQHASHDNTASETGHRLPVQPHLTKTAVSSQAAAAPSPRASILVHRPRSNPSPGSHGIARANTSASAAEPFDMSLAYGSIPPDLVSRWDLDANAADGVALLEDSDQREQEQARSLVSRIESLLDEAHCIHHSATSIIAHLQSNPEAAAAVALTLAELSNLLAKLSPAFLSVIKGGSPAVFALLASPQFLIGTGIAVGITIILFGGWKIIKRIKETQAGLIDDKQAQASETTGPLPIPPRPYQPPEPRFAAADRGPFVMSARHYEEALVLEQELSTIDTWRRGIVPPLNDCGGNGNLRLEDPWNGTEAEVELISPEAMRSRIGFSGDDNRMPRRDREHLARPFSGSVGGTDMKTALPTHHSRHHYYSHRRIEHHGNGSSRGKRLSDPHVVPDRKYSQVCSTSEGPGGGRNRDKDANGQGGRSSRRSRGHLGRHRDDATDADSVSASRSRHSHHNGRGGRADSRIPECRTAAVLSPSPVLPPDSACVSSSKGKKSPATSGNILRQLFKKKSDKEDHSRAHSAALSEVV